jgi:undecaprenyl phosphate N,N'-diacetylbacillosamine 1-phosphate transferase
MIYRVSIKRLLDIVLALFSLILLAPVLTLSTLLIRFTSTGRVIFTQHRVGINGRHFQLLKFRTMTDRERDPTQQVLAGHSEITAVGRFLRRTKIDELPQLVNILVGDMSIVGPRPCLPETVEKMPAWALRRFDVPPGLTGLAQVNGNVSLTWEERWKYDVHYAETCSLSLDLTIVARTFLVLALGEERLKTGPR